MARRIAAKVDNNQGEIVQTLQNLGCSVTDLSGVGKGVPDLVIGYRQRNYFVEVKSPKGKLTEAQILWHQLWRGQVVVIRSVKMAIDWVRSLDCVI